MPRDPNITKGRKMADPIVGQAWHEDGTPFNKADYIKAGLTPPTDEQLLAWAEAERQNPLGIFHQNGD